jgi:hypothetical protein
MKVLKYFFGCIVAVVLFTACTKEYSFENPFANSGNVTIGNNCIIAKVIEYDTLGNRGASAINYLFNAAGDRVVSVNQTDSITLNSLLNKTVSYLQDTMRLDAGQFFTVDLATARVKSFTGRENPYNNTSPVFSFKYNYDASGKINTKTKTNPLFPTFIIESTEYVFTNNDLTGIVKKLPLLNTTIFTASLEYDNSRQPKNYFSMLPDCNELAPYVAALNTGARSLHPVKKIVIKNFDQLTGAFIDSTVTNFSNYKYSLDNYVLSLDASGFDIPALPLVSGRNKFEYFCR